MSALAVSTRPTAQSKDDHELIAAVRDGDDRAFEMLFERYQARIAGYVRSMVRDHGRAEDITQDVFISALRRIRANDREIAFKPWIFEIAKNACIDAFRRGRNTHEVSFDADDALDPADQRHLASIGSSPDAVMDTKLALDDLCGAFGGLSQTHHDILVMREFDGLTYREIGEQLRMTEGAVESALFRARRRLGEEYEEIASGERCTRVRGIVDAPSGHALGLRERRRMRRHVSHCQPCRRYALRAGVDIGAVQVPASRGARVAALLPLPGFLRRRTDAEHAGQLFAPHAPAVSIINVLDPAVVSSWCKSILAAATFAVAGLGASVAIDQRSPLADLVGRAPALLMPLTERSAVGPASSSAAPEQATPIGAEPPAIRADSPGTTSPLDRNAAGPLDGRPGAQGSKTSPGAPGRSSSGAAPPAPGTAKQDAALEGKNPAADEPAAKPNDEPSDKPTGQLQGLKPGQPGVVANATKPLPPIKPVVGALKDVVDVPGGIGVPSSSDVPIIGGGGTSVKVPLVQKVELPPVPKPKPVKTVPDVVGGVVAGLG